MLSAAPAHARPSFELQATGARAGDVVGFTVSGVDGWGVAYHLEMGGTDLASGRNGGYVAGSFTVPDLGEEARTVTVEATLWWSDTQRTVWRAVEYLGAALPVPAQDPAPVSTAPATGPTAAPEHSPGPASAGSPSPAAAPALQRKGRGLRKRQTSSTRQSAAPAAERHLGGQRRRAGNDRQPAKHRRARRVVRRPSDFLGKYQGPRASLAGNEESTSGNPTARPGIASASSPGGLDGSVKFAIVAPVLGAIAALALVAAVVLRGRRLASRAGRH